MVISASEIPRYVVTQQHHHHCSFHHSPPPAYTIWEFPISTRALSCRTRWINQTIHPLQGHTVLSPLSTHPLPLVYSLAFRPRTGLPRPGSNARGAVCSLPSTETPGLDALMYQFCTARDRLSIPRASWMGAQTHPCSFCCLRDPRHSRVGMVAGIPRLASTTPSLTFSYQS